ncbi:MAG: tetratricopeptide repeat protein [Planctomycetota bacterium]
MTWTRIPIAIVALLVGTLLLWQGLTNRDVLRAPDSVCIAGVACLLLAVICLFKRSWKALLAVVALLVLALTVVGRVTRGQGSMLETLPKKLVAIAAFIVLVLVFAMFRDRVTRRASRMVQAGDVEGALEYLRSQLRRRPRSVPMHSALAAFLGRHKRWQEALDVLDAAASLPGGREACLENRALVLWNLGRRDEATTLMQEVLRRRPNDFHITYNLGMLHADSGDRNAAMRMLERAERLSRRFPIITRKSREIRNRLLDDLRERVSRIRSPPT